MRTIEPGIIAGAVPGITDQTLASNSAVKTFLTEAAHTYVQHAISFTISRGHCATPGKPYFETSPARYCSLTSLDEQDAESQRRSTTADPLTQYIYVTIKCLDPEAQSN